MSANDPAAPLSLRLLGPVEVLISGQLLPRLRFRKSQAILALLALRQGGEVERDWLAGLLWPDSAPSPARHSLRNCLTDLRAALGPEAGRLRSPASRSLALDLTDAFVDVLAFDAALAQGDSHSLAAAVALYQGPLLDGWEEAWAFQERQAREQGYLGALEKLAAQAQEKGKLAEAEQYLRQAVATDPLRESAHRALLAVLAASGNYTAVLASYQELRLRLHREANSEPDPETQALFRRLRDEAQAKASVRGSQRSAESTMASVASRDAGSGGDLSLPSTAPAQPPGGHHGAGILHKLPLSLTSFIGRQDEMAAIQQLLAAHRLVTLTGAGGCGKTRLALETAMGLPSCYPDGVWSVGLAALADPAVVPQTVAAALGIREEPGRPVTQTLAASLKQKCLLLLLDNCEHLVGACGQLAETLLQTCPYLRLLATSREPLGCEGEWLYRVPSLSLPPATGVGSGARLRDTPPPALDALLQYEAIRLFVERAAAAQPGFAATAENAPLVARICRRLDGIPLAIELAAARLKALPLDTLHERLADMFGLLTGGRRTALPQHQTLRAAIDWSYALLTPEEQTLLRRLSVFAGGCTLAAVEAVCGDARNEERGMRNEEARGASSSPIPHSSLLVPDAVLDLLTRLVEKSLVIYEERGGEGRYRLLEMVREYARERLAESGETGALRERHARFFLALAETAERELTQADPGLWLDRLEREHDNLRTALTWSVESGEVDVGLRLGSALQEFWISRGHAQEGTAQLRRLLARPEAAAPGPALQGGAAARARALSAAGILTLFGGELEAARALWEESLAIWRRLEDRAGIATVLYHLGRLAVDQWDWTTAGTRVEESLAIWRALGDPAGMANALSLLAEVCRQAGDAPAARALIEESLAIWRERGDRSRLMAGLDTLARAAMQEGDFEAARPAIEESLTVARELGHKPGIAGALTALGHVAHWQEEYLAARAYFQETLVLWRELDHKYGIVDTIGHLALTYIAVGESAAAYRVLEEMLPLARTLAPLYVARCLASLAGCAAGMGRWEEATAYSVESLRMGSSSEYEDPIHIAWDLTVLSGIALAQGRPARAARLLGAAELLWAGSTHRNHPLVRDQLARAEEAVRGQMEGAEYEAAWAEGQATPLEQTIAELLEEAGG